ncbi:MAG: AraC family transcriptional regulator ligand-binding domain-containing protein [Gammaproteobacteria bacterium]|nr:AraC family transcriptional regulator ligand-binding domain-containing protein [Gammaproteobacteria bacterium]
MQTIDREVPARYFGRLLELLTQHQVRIDTLVDGLGIDMATLLAPEATMRLSQVDTLVQRLNAQTGRLDWGFDLGLRLRLTSHLILGYGLLASPTIGYAFQLLSRYFSMLTPTFRVQLQRDAQHGALQLVPVLPMSHACLVFHTDAIAAAVDTVVGELLGDRMPRYDLDLALDLPHRARYDALRQARCRFGVGGMAGLRIRFPIALLEAPLSLADAGALKEAESRCVATFRSVIASGQVAGWVRMMLREANGGLPSLDDLAHTLNLSSRTLDRHLKAEGTGFRQLAAEVVVERAQALLAQGLPVTTVALELGYTDASNFTRAFRRATGGCPSRTTDGQRQATPTAAGRPG